MARFLGCCAAVVGVWAVFSGCDTESRPVRKAADAGTDAGTVPSGSVGAAGGTVDLSGGARITVPAGAVRSGVEVRGAVVTNAPAALPSNLVQGGSVYVFTPHGTTFMKPATVRIPATSSRGAVYFLSDEQDTTWEPVPGVIRTGAFYEFALTHISLFAELVGANATDAGAEASVPPPTGTSDAGHVVPDASLSVPPSCEGLPANCGPNQDESCCESPLVPGGTYDRGRFGGISTTSSMVTVSSFRLDKYEVTVGRFRKFVEAYVAGWRPSPGDGKHAHLNGGRGLSNYDGTTYEPGWVAPAKTPYAWFVWPLPATSAAWDTRLLSASGCDVLDDGGWLQEPGVISCQFCKDYPSLPCFQTWSSEPSSVENKPVNQLQWIEAYAFCIWDGGFLPSLAESEYAAAGGAEMRPYPWGTQAPGPNAELLVYDCRHDDTPGRAGTPDGSRVECTGANNIARVGSAPAGNGKWGHADLAGNVHEWTVDSHTYKPSPACTDCGYFTTCYAACDEGPSKLGGTDYSRSLGYPIMSENTNGGGMSTIGVRCAREP